MRSLQIAACLAVLWFAISFGLLGFWILLCLAVRMHESNKMRRHFGYMTRRRDLQNLYSKETQLDEKLRPYRTIDIEGCAGQFACHPDGSWCYGLLCYCGTHGTGVVQVRRRPF